MSIVLLMDHFLHGLERVCEFIDQQKEKVNVRFRTTEPAILIFTTAALSVLIQYVIYKTFYGGGFAPNRRRGILARLRNLPIIRNYVQKELSKVALQVEGSLNKHYSKCEFILELPDKPWSPEDILAEMQKNHDLVHVEWKKGCVSGAIYSKNDKQLEEMMTTVFSRNLRSNPLHSDIFVGVRKMESEVIRWCCNLFHGGDESCGSMTSGGTESLILACKAYRDYAYSEKGIAFPEMVVPVTAHAGFDKAGQYLRIKVVHVPVDPKTMKVNVKKMAAAITGNTIMLVGSCPQFPHGAIDPIQQIAQLGAKHDIPVHVDACLGGFLVPFMEEAGFPIQPFDFRVEGVTSISADTHKYAYTPKGSSIIMYSDKKFHHYQFSVATDWPGGVYCTPTISGSRAGAVPACTWASLLYYGRQGYIDATRSIIATTRKIIEEVKKVEGIFVMGTPEASVIAVGSRRFDIFQLMEMLTQRGWSLNPLQYPAGFHLCVTLLHVSENVADRFLLDIKECTAEIMKHPRRPSKGQAAIYGMAQSIPDRSVVEDLAIAYIDACYSTRYIKPS